MTQAVQTTSDPLRWIDPRVLMRIDSLEMRARMVVEGFMAGLNRSPFHGHSVEFTEYRDYQPGDDLRYLDWKLYARRGRRYIRRYEDETNVCCQFLVDLSSSMQFGSVGYRKEDYVKTLVATLSCFLIRQRDAVGVVTFDESVREYIPARFVVNQLRRVLVALTRVHERTGTDLSRPVTTVAECVRRRGLVVLISDLLFEPETLGTQCGFLRARGHDVMVLQVLDPAELDLDGDGAMLFEDLETGRRRMVDVSRQRADYRRRMADHLQALDEVCSAQGVELHRLLTDEPLERSLEAVLRRRSRQSRGTAQRGSEPAATGREGSAA